MLRRNGQTIRTQRATHKSGQPHLQPLRDYYDRHLATGPEQWMHDIASSAARRGHLEHDEFVSICMWKTPRQKNNYLANTSSAVRQRTAAIFTSRDDVRVMQSLIELKGVAVPVGSALLAVCLPERYGVIDVRAWATLHSWELVPDDSFSSYDLDAWARYCRVLRRLGDDAELTPREVDKALFAFDATNRRGTLYG